MLRLALPVVMAELGWMAMGVVDTVMVGRLSPEAIGAVGVSSNLFMGLVVFAMGLMLGLDTLVSQAFGAGRLEECHRWLLHGMVMSGVISIPTTLVIFAITRQLGGWGVDPAVLALTQPYLDVLAWSVLPLLLYAAFRRYLQGMGVVRPIMIALIASNISNLFLNWVLVYGNLGAPAMGVRGSAWSTVVARVVMMGYLGLVIIRRERNRRPGLLETSWRIERAWLQRLIALGFPAAGQLTLEVGVFAAATVLAGRLAPVDLASHQIALNISSVTFMVPLGVSAAGAVRVGHAIGRRDVHGAETSGWTALIIGVSFMAVAALVLIGAPRPLIGAFSSDDGVLRVSTTLLQVAAVFQLFDGLQCVATGVLRGLGDTRTAMLWNLVAHWFLGLPFGYVLCFVANLGVAGLWWGLSTGLIICGVGLLVVWTRHISAEKRQAGLA